MVKFTFVSHFVSQHIFLAFAVVHMEYDAADLLHGRLAYFLN